MNRILTAQDAAQSLGYSCSSREWMIEYSKTLKFKKIVLFECSGKVIKRYSVHAKIDYGRWIAQCPVCSRIGYVDPADPVFYCFGCGNQGSGCFVPVVFPDDIDEITALILARPVIENESDTNLISKATGATPFYPNLARNWNVEQTVEDLAIENKIMEKSNG